MAEPSEHAATLLARLDGVVHLDLVVAATSELAHGVREVRLAGVPDAFSHEPGQDVMLGVHDATGAHRWRRYTVRARDGDTIRLWLTTDTSGPGAAWARGAARGSTVEALGPRGKIRLTPDASLHVFVVDESGVAAAAAMAEALEPPCRMHLVAPPDLLDAASPQLAPGVAGGSDALGPGPGAQGLSSVLGRALGADAGRAAAYAFGELSLVRRAREALLELGVSEERIAHKAYWRADRSNEPHGEPARASQ